MYIGLRKNVLLFVVSPPDDRPFGLEQAISKVWFYKQFNAESLTYEIGDETPRDFIDLKVEVAAREMMKLLILK